MEINNCKLITDENYPILLKEINKDAPKQLYYKGSWDKNIFQITKILFNNFL